ncbi:MAG: DUF2225 domain-containing protein [Planctomycetes bacterium]|nr:DUF2225 domain-containing protein [Planctomycetota bacterium]
MLKLLVLLLAAAPDETRKVDVVCPVDGTKFTAIEVLRTDRELAWGGLDSDFCAHASKTTPMEYYIWTCPRCLFSGPKRDFDPKHAPPEKLKTKIREGLRPLIPVKPDAAQSEIPGHVKYDLLSQIEAWRGKPPERIAARHLHAAWAERQAGAVWLIHFDEWMDLRESYGMNKSPLELGKRNRSEMDLTICRAIEKDVAAGKHRGTTLLLARYLLAHTYRRRGENVLALRWLDEVAKSKGENSVVDDACERMRKSIAFERRHQSKAAEFFRRAVEESSLDPKSKAECLFQLGEIARRRGDGAAAAAWYAQAIDLTPDPNLKKRAETQKSLGD